MAAQVGRQHPEVAEPFLRQAPEADAVARDPVQAEERPPAGGPHSWTCRLTRVRLSGVLAVLYDIHANLPALEAVLAEARAEGVSGFFLGGGLRRLRAVSPRDAGAARRAAAATWIRGNGERWLREPPVDRPEILDNVRRMGAPFSEDERERLYRLPARAEVDGVVFVHGCWPPTWTASRGSPQPADALRVGGLVGRTLVFGHSHLQFRRPGPNDNELVNPGSVGMPLDGDARAAWACGTGPSSPSAERSTTSSAPWRLRASSERGGSR